MSNDKKEETPGKSDEKLSNVSGGKIVCSMLNGGPTVYDVIDDESGKIVYRTGNPWAAAGANRFINVKKAPLPEAYYKLGTSLK